MMRKVSREEYEENLQMGEPFMDRCDNCGLPLVEGCCHECKCDKLCVGCTYYDENMCVSHEGCIRAEF